MEWLRYNNQNAIRNKPLSPKLVNALSFLPEMGIEMSVFSGGETEDRKASNSGRHLHGNSADADFYKNGRKLDWNNPDDVPIFQEMVRRGKQRGLTGWGAGDDYMGAGRLHVGFGNPGIWGADGKGANAPGWLREAYHGEPGHVHQPGDENQKIADATMAALGKQPQRSAGAGLLGSEGNDRMTPQPQQRGLLSAEPEKSGLFTPEQFARFQMAVEGMSLRPNQGIMKAAEATLTNSAESKKVNKTAQWLAKEYGGKAADAFLNGVPLSQIVAQASRTADGPGVGAQQILPNGTTIQSMSDGSVRVTTAAGERLTGEAAQQAVLDAQQYGVGLQRDIYGGRREGTNVAEAETGAAAAQAGETGKQSVKLSGEFFNKYNAINSSLTAIDRAITALDNGAASGVAANMLPDVTRASGELRSAMNELGLSVVSGTTFGALSEGELRLALATAVPQDLPPPELKAWLVERKAAQQKAAQELANAAAFFAGGGTIGDYIKQYGGTKAGGITTAPLAPAAGGLSPEAQKWLGE